MCASSNILAWRRKASIGGLLFMKDAASSLCACADAWRARGARLRGDCFRPRIRTAPLLRALPCVTFPPRRGVAYHKNKRHMNGFSSVASANGGTALAARWRSGISISRRRGQRRAASASSMAASCVRRSSFSLNINALAAPRIVAPRITGRKGSAGQRRLAQHNAALRRTASASCACGDVAWRHAARRLVKRVTSFSAQKTHGGSWLLFYNGQAAGAICASRGGVRQISHPRSAATSRSGGAWRYRQARRCRQA